MNALHSLCPAVTQWIADNVPSHALPFSTTEVLKNAFQLFQRQHTKECPRCSKNSSTGCFKN